jgi:SAM-dependent methyltransferase
VPPPPQDTSPYDALAAGYDVVMAHVDYAGWADYVLDLLDAHDARPRSVLELGCGTGSLALEVVERLGKVRFLATDRSPAMIRVARAKAKTLGRSALTLRFDVADFTDFAFNERFDVGLLLYDGLNYLLDDADVAALLARAHDALAPGGLFVVDQSTPATSVNNADFFGDEGEVDRFAYVRRSRYDEATRIHTTEFDLTIDGETYAERHLQRAYAKDEVEALVAASPLDLVAAYDGFTLDPATAASERIHWVLRRPRGARP